MSPRPHFLVLTFPLQGHIAPAVRLARRLLAAAPDALVTFSTTVDAHRRMFPAKSEGPDGAVKPHGDDDGRLEFLPFSDGNETGDVRSSDPAAVNEYMASFHTVGPRSTGELVDALAARGRPVSRVVYTLLLPWAADVARARGVPSALYWIQPVAVFAIYYHYFHGHAGVVIDHLHDPSFVVQLPGLAPQAVGDLPSFLTDSTNPSDGFHSIYTTLHDLFDTIDRETPKATVLVNTCQELEVDALAAMGAHDVLPIGPVLPSGDEAGLFKQDDTKYMEWLDTKPTNSVVYVSFGSLATMGRDQLDELLIGLEESGRPYLCVVRKDNKAELAEAEAEIDAGLKNGLVVEWCDQMRVLSHAAVGCFVTHCGWNSVLESVACGVPMVGVPRMSDQRINARLVEHEWRVGVRAEVDGGVLRAGEVRRRVEEVMGEGETAAEVRRVAREWKPAVAEALGKGGSSDHNLMAFVEGARGEDCQAPLRANEDIARMADTSSASLRTNLSARAPCSPVPSSFLLCSRLRASTSPVSYSPPLPSSSPNPTSPALPFRLASLPGFSLRCAARGHAMGTVARPPGAEPLKQRVNRCLLKLSDRDTKAMSVAELEAIAHALSVSS